MRSTQIENKTDEKPCEEDIEHNEKQKDLIPGYSSMKEFTKDGFKILVEATKNANALPQERNWDYYNTHQVFRNLMNEEGANILHLINNLIREQGVHGSFSSRDMDEKIEVIVEANDSILERAAINLDVINGIRKNPELHVKMQAVSAVLPVSGSWNKIDNINCTVSSFEPANKKSLQNAPNAIRLITGNNIQRPQKFFKDRIENSSKYPWEPRIKEKPNSLKPLAVFLEDGENDTEVFSHPYEFELERFEPSPDLLTAVKPLTPKPLTDTPLRMVETADELTALVEDLRNYSEIAIDLEHHSYRTFLGITCLMQISTRDTDYIIDTLTLRDKLCILNEVFTKPSIVKIFHGADHDIEWLQRDLSLYIVNMFDTFQAAKQLGYEQRSLAYLMKKFCQVDANKHFQLADWRIRPLPDELKLYAREDTHYLTYIYHMMRNELVELGNKGSHILKSVIQRSTDLCKKRYAKPVLQDESHMDLYRRCKKMFDNKQMCALKELYGWRDSMARTEDESTGYVLPNHMLLQIAELLPREMQGVLACCNPIPPLVRANLLEIHKIVLHAREQSLVKPILSEEARSRGSTQTVTRINVDNVLNCPHDLSNTKEFRDDLPTLLGNILKLNTTESQTSDKKTTSKIFEKRISPTLVENDAPVIDIFDKIEDSLKKMETEVFKKLKKFKFLGPFERYKLVKPYMQAEEEKQAMLHKEIVPEGVNGKEKITEDGTSKGNEETDRTVEERISKLQEHFQIAASSIPQKQPELKGKSSRYNPTSLRQMTGCKRKRSPSHHVEEEVDESSMIDSVVGPLMDVRPNPNVLGFYPKTWGKETQPETVDERSSTEMMKIMDGKIDNGQILKQSYGKNKVQSFTKLIPNLNKKIKRQRKRENMRMLKKKWMEQQNNSSHQENPSQQIPQQSNSTQNKFNSQPGQQNIGQQQLNSQHFKNKHKKQKFNQQPYQHNIQQPNPAGNQQGTKRPNTQQQITQNNKQPKNQHVNSATGGNLAPPQRHQQAKQTAVSAATNVASSSNVEAKQQPKNKIISQNEFKAFDYSAVDFKQFQGGAGTANSATNVKSNFKNKKQKGKGKGKSNAKSAVFDMGRTSVQGGKKR